MIVGITFPHDFYQVPVYYHGPVQFPEPDNTGGIAIQWPGFRPGESTSRKYQPRSGLHSNNQSNITGNV